MKSVNMKGDEPPSTEKRQGKSTAPNSKQQAITCPQPHTKNRHNNKNNKKTLLL
jgi:hypothetical protein